MNENLLSYKLGGLLYTPAADTKIADKIAEKVYPCLTASAFCLEDSIRDEALAEAENALLNTFSRLQQRDIPKEELPFLFVRVRSYEHLKKVHNKLGETAKLLTGYILPKFDLTNIEGYLEVISDLNANSSEPVYCMPIIETKSAADISTRAQTLVKIKEILDGAKKYVLNVRVGGNDFCNLYGLRRNRSQTIYDIGPVRDILVDILNVFAGEYTVSGPVWEYFGADPDGEWAAGLRRELELDRASGFIGKTAIHPCQLPLIYESMKVSKADYDDAKSILEWNSEMLGVAAGSTHSRMNEVKCHTRWAERIALLAEIYGIRGEE